MPNVSASGPGEYRPLPPNLMTRFCAAAQSPPALSFGVTFLLDREPLRESGFVALSQTMPCILGNAWFALMRFSQQWSLLHRQPELMEQAIEELLRYAGLVRILSRTATTDIDLNGAFIRSGRTRRPEDQLRQTATPSASPIRTKSISRAAMRGISLWVRVLTHVCAANLIRLAAIAITRPLVQRFASANLSLPVDWQGGSGFRSPKSLWVHLTTADRTAD